MNDKQLKELRDAERSRDLGVVLSTHEGRRFVWDLLNRRCKLKQQVPTGPDGIRYEGRRDVAAEMERDIKVLHPRFYQLMAHEGIDAEVDELLTREAKAKPKEIDE